MQSSRHAHDLVVRMLEYQTVDTGSDRTADLSETTRRTIVLLQDSPGTNLNIKYSVDDNLHTTETDVIALQQLLIHQFHLFQELSPATGGGKRRTSKVMSIGVRLDTSAELTCMYCEKHSKGQLLNFEIASGKAARSPAGNQPASDELLFELENPLSELHQQVSTLDGHLSVTAASDGSQCWAVVIPLNDEGRNGLRLNTSVPLENYRQRRRKRKE